MKKKDILILVALVALMMAWPFIDRYFVKPVIFNKAPDEPMKPAQVASVPTNPPATETAVAPDSQKVVPVAQQESIAQAPITAPAVPEPVVIPQPDTPEELVVLENSDVSITVSSHGAGINSATLAEFRRTIDKDSGPVVLDFSPRKALVYRNLPGISEVDGFDITMDDSTEQVVLSHQASDGLLFRRTITLGENYLVLVSDEFVNTRSVPLELTNSRLQLGSMNKLSQGKAMRGIIEMGVDSLSPGEKVKYWGKKIPGYFKKQKKATGILPVSITQNPYPSPIDWVAAKNKYFVQILTPLQGASSFEVLATRQLALGEKSGETLDPDMQQLKSVSAEVVFEDVVLAPQEVLVREMSYYVGPKQYSELIKMPLKQVDVMQLGKLAPVGKLLLRGMNLIYKYLWPHNYGIAIMLLTVLIRIVFWPVTHKSTESMKRMQEIQPLVAEVRERVKDSQKQQQEIMALYKQHKVNPLGGCLPMLIQIPVFIALFSVLRSSIELRFAPFLWISDLSQPENLFAGVLPIPLNILPLIMSITMFWQQKLTPTASDSQQQKMMAFMPLIMLFFFYKFASGLVLYWTTNQCLMIAQQLITRRKQARAKLAKA